MPSKPNSDIGLNSGDADYLRSQFPKIAEALIWPELVAEFKVHEQKASSLKTSSRRNSFTAIVLIVCSLAITLVATSEVAKPLVAIYAWANQALATLSLLLFLGAIFIGKGIMFGRRRDRWLRHRLIAERLRQFYFQFILSHRNLICSDGVIAFQNLIEARALALEAVMRKLDSSVYSQIVRDDANLEEARLVELNSQEHSDLDAKCLDELERFWEKLRFDWQIGYSTEQRMRRASPFPIFGSLADQEHTASSLEFIATVSIILLQCVAVAGQFFGEPGSSLVSVTVLLASLSAIIIVGLQAYRNGMGLTEDLTRNRVYASYSAKLLRDFGQAKRDGELEARFRVMQEMEDLAYFETREFLHTHSTARFSL